MDNNYDFIIKNPKWHRNVFFIFLVSGVLVTLAVLVGWLIVRFDWGILVGIALICFVEYTIGSLGLFIWYREEFCFKNGFFTYKKAFGKQQTVSVTDVAKVKLDRAGAFQRITFISKEGKVLMRFCDDGTAFRNNHLIAVLMHYDVPIVWR